jgi:hypothetical protein
MKIVDLPNKPSDADIEISNLEKSLPNVLKSIAIRAIIRRHSYECLLNEGFSEEQALEIIINDNI